MVILLDRPKQRSAAAMVPPMHWGRSAGGCPEVSSEVDLIASQRWPANGDHRAIGDGLPIMFHTRMPKRILARLSQVNRVDRRRILSVTEVEAKVTSDEDRNSCCPLIGHKTTGISFTGSMYSPFDLQIISLSEVAHLEEMADEPTSSLLLSLAIHRSMTDHKSGCHGSSVLHGDSTRSDCKRKSIRRSPGLHRSMRHEGDMTMTITMTREI